MRYLLCNNCRHTIEIHNRDQVVNCPVCGNNLKNRQILKNSGAQKLKTKDRP